jgi:hypothetical protein
MQITRALFSSMVALLSGCGSGSTDGEFPISNGYVLSDAGGNERAIAYVSGRTLGPFIIDARVDSYFVDGKRIIVARRPVETVMRNGIADVRLSPACEYWMIDTETHAVKQITDASRWPVVRCDMGRTYGATEGRAQ